jgi:hypothetical protein
MRLLAEGVDKVFLYSMHAQSSLDAKPNFRAIVTPEGALHPSGVAHGILAWQLEATRFIEMITVAEGVHAYVFSARDGSRAVAAISAEPGKASWVLPDVEGWSAIDLFGNPIEAGTGTV